MTQRYEDAKLRSFVSAARLGGFTAAARALGITQPAVSQQISDLEKCFGTALFVRGRGELVLTPAGEVFLQYAERILDGYERVDALFGPLTAAGRSTARLTLATSAFCQERILPLVLDGLDVVSGLELITNTYSDSAFFSVMPPVSEDLYLFTGTPEEVLSADFAPWVRSSLTLPSGRKLLLCLKPSPAFSGTALYRILSDRLASL